MIALEGIEKVYRTEQVETVALSNINFAVDEGEFISVMGRPARARARYSTSSACSTNLPLAT